MEPGYTPESAHEPQEQETTQQDNFEALAESLGFRETPELKQLRSALITNHERGEEPEQLEAIVELYKMLGEAEVEQFQGQDYMKAQIGLIIATARLRQAIGSTELALEDLTDAAEYADNIGMSKVADELQDAIVDIETRDTTAE